MDLRLGAGLIRRWMSSSSAPRTIPIIERAQMFQGRQAVVDKNGENKTYEELLGASNKVSGALKKAVGKDNLKGDRVAFLCDPGSDYVAAQWGSWQSGGCAVPLCISHPKPELEYVLDNCGASAIVADKKYAKLGQELADEHGYKFVPLEDDSSTDTDMCKWDPDAPAMFVYTSGTTGKPKGVVTRHSALQAQILDQYCSWGWDESDRVINCLPLHHVHGVVNLTCVPLYSGACIEFMSPRAERIWQRIRMGPLAGGDISVFMAVPTIYSRLIKSFEEMHDNEKKACTESARELRLMVSGSAALPDTVMERWKEITGHTLLQRYGMTEIGMALSQPLRPVSERHTGYVGTPMPSVSVKLVCPDTGDELDPNTGAPGILHVKGENVFQEYYKNPQATAKEFDQDGWFITGDVASYSKEKNSYKILGRASVDIIKSAGYKLSALEIERHFLENPWVDDIAVLGIPDEEYGEVVAAVVVPSKNVDGSLDALKKWADVNIAKYKHPRKFVILDELPKNAMGKVNKKDLRTQLFDKK